MTTISVVIPIFSVPEVQRSVMGTDLIWRVRMELARRHGTIPFMIRERKTLSLLVLVLIPSLVAQQVKSDPTGPIVAALRAKDNAQALQLLQAALLKSPDDVRLWTYRGVALSGEGKSEEALSAYRHALKISPNFLAALAGAAEILYRAGDQKAVSLLDRLVRLRPNDSTSHAMLGELAYTRGDCKSAVLHFERSGALAATQSAALQKYGACLTEEGQSERAVSVFEQLLAVNPESSQARRNLATVQNMAGHSEEARSTLLPLLAAGNQEVSTLRLAAAVYEANKDTPQAVKLLRDAIIRDPGNVSLYVDFANIAFTHQSFQAGVEMLNAGLTAQPNAAPLYLARGVLYVQLAEYEKAEADFEKAERLDPRQSLSATAMGLVAEQKNQDPEKVLATLHSRLALRPNDPDLLYLQATLLAEKAPVLGSPEFRLAVRSAQQAVALQPGMLPARNVLTKLYLQAGQTDLAIRECRQTLTRDPKDQTALYHLIQALRKTDSKSEFPDLLKRLAEARQAATKEEAERNRYKLVVQQDDAPGQAVTNQ
jgi:tetratricopeptide (TPR) repeat protein